MIKRVKARINMYLALALLFFSLSAAAKPISISQISGLNFGVAVSGDPSKTVPPGTSENSQNASFRVTGDKWTTYAIILPSSATISTTVNGKTDTITISNFKSYPVWEGYLDSRGRENLFVGATRSAIKVNQLAGSYSGVFTMTVVY